MCGLRLCVTPAPLRRCLCLGGRNAKAREGRKDASNKRGRIGTLVRNTAMQGTRPDDWPVPLLIGRYSPRCSCGHCGTLQNTQRHRNDIPHHFHAPCLSPGGLSLIPVYRSGVLRFNPHKPFKELGTHSWALQLWPVQMPMQKAEGSLAVDGVRPVEELDLCSLRNP